MRVIKPNDKSWEEKNGYSKKVFLTPEELNSSGNLVQQIKIKPGDTAGEHYHKQQTEVFYFLNENGHWIINGEKHTFKTGEILVIEPNDKHIVVNDTNEDYLYLVFKVNFQKDDSFWTE